MNVELTKKAKRQLGNLPKSEAKKVARKLFQLERSPFTGKKLAGKLQTRYSLKAWPYRIIVTVQSSDTTSSSRGYEVAVAISHLYEIASLALAMTKSVSGL